MKKNFIKILLAMGTLCSFGTTSASTSPTRVLLYTV